MDEIFRHTFDVERVAILQHHMAFVRKAVQLQKPPGHFLKIPGVTVCKVHWSRHYEPSYIARLILSEPIHVLYLPTKQRYQERVRDGLWWYVTSNSMGGMRVMRARCSRRMRNAVTQALLARGYDKEGKTLGPLGAEKVAAQLRGTLDIQILNQCVNTDWVEVQKQAGVVLDKIMELCCVKTPSGDSPVVLEGG